MDLFLQAIDKKVPKRCKFVLGLDVNYDKSKQTQTQRRKIRVKGALFLRFFWSEKGLGLVIIKGYGTTRGK